MKKSQFRCLCAALVLLLAAAPFAAAQQADTALIVGTVSDTTGAVIPGVDVTFNHVETGIVSTTQTNESGNYRSNPLRIGNYIVVVEADGFKAYSGSGVTLSIGDVRELNVALEVGRGDRGHRSRGVRAAAADHRELGRHGDRKPSDRGLAAQRPRLPAACRDLGGHRRLPRPGHFDRRPARHRNQLHDRRHGQQQPVHRLAGRAERNRQAFGGRGGRVQGHHQRLCRRIRQVVFGHRLAGHQVGNERHPRHGLLLHARRNDGRQAMVAAGPSSRPRQAAVRAQAIRLRRRRPDQEEQIVPVWATWS